MQKRTKPIMPPPVDNIVSLEHPRLFVSHDSRDAVLADAFVRMVQAATGNRVKCFCSSGKESIDGIPFGEEWFHRLILEINKTSHFVCIFTEHSLLNKWVHFEAGFAKGRRDIPIIGVAVGIDKTEIDSGPFIQFQNMCDGASELREFLKQLQNHESIPGVDDDFITGQIELYQKRRSKFLHERALDVEDRNKTRAQDKLIDTSGIGLVKIYPSYVEAQATIEEKMKAATGSVRVFLQIGKTSASARGPIARYVRRRNGSTGIAPDREESVSDLLEKAGDQSRAEFRVLHAAMDSPLFARERLSRLRKDPDEVAACLSHVHETLDRLHQQAGRSLIHRGHTIPFIWRMYAFEDRLFLMPYYSQKAAHEVSPVLEFEKSERSLYGSFVSWFDYAWESFAPKVRTIGDFIMPATPAGAALFLRWKGHHVFAIPIRDIRSAAEGHPIVRFYGVGGKRKSPTEPLHLCALREGQEETGGAVARLIPAPTTDFWHADGSLEEGIAFVDTDCTPRLILEKGQHTGLGSMAVNRDKYYLVGYDAELAKEPVPSSDDVAGLLFMSDAGLQRAKRHDATLAELLEVGCRIVMREGVTELSPSIQLVPHGAAVYLCQKINSNGAHSSRSV